MIIASEQVGKGHPDKIADQISDTVLQIILELDNNSRVACETLITNGEIFIRGEINLNEKISLSFINKIILERISELISSFNYQPDDFKININLVKQSLEISQAVDKEEEIFAGDQGIIFGYATNETKYYLPLPYVLATKILKNLDDSEMFAPNYDAKSQVSFNYETNKINNFLVSIQHKAETKLEDLRKFVVNEVKSLAKEFSLNEDFEILVNPSGSFIVGGPKSDVGLTGRKIIADTYGGFAKHGGGAFSGKDFTKVDRSAAYILRYVAKNIVHYNLADKIEIQLSYAIGVKNPISINIDTFGTNKIPEEKIIEFINNNFDLTPSGINQELKLNDTNEVNYPDTAKYGHFLCFESKVFPWEKIREKNTLKF